MASKARRIWAAGLVAMLLTVCIPIAGLAQAKPKRDVTKDQVERPRRRAKLPARSTQSVTTPAQPARPSTKRRVTQAERPVATREAHTSVAVPQASKETFLRVNQLSQLERKYPADGGEETFQVSCDDTTWIACALPKWCSVRKSGAFFTLTYGANPNHEARKDWFVVRKGELSVRIDVSQAPSPGIGGIESYLMWHNEPVEFSEESISPTASVGGLMGASGEEGGGRVTGYVTSKHTLVIKAKGHVREPLGKKWAVLARFQYLGGKFVKANTNYKYGQHFLGPYEGELYGLAEFTPRAEDNGYFEVTIQIPNEAFLLPYNCDYDLHCVLSLLCESCVVKSTTRLPDITFQAKSKKGKIKTK